MSSSLYVDSITGMNNLFALILSDIGTLCGSYGTVLYIDMKNLLMVNMTHGRQMGDAYIEQLAGILKSSINADTIHTDSSMFRLAGDEFIVVFPESYSDQLEAMVAGLDRSLAEKMQTLGVSEAGIHYVLWMYKSPITSIAYLLKQSCLMLDHSRSNQHTGIPDWADLMISKMIQTVKETLLLLQEAEALSLEDDITHLPNHRAARESLNRALTDYQLSGKPFSILFLDGDNLKRYNEISYRYGNDMICKLGGLIKKSIRDDDLLFRWLSGDEFMVLLRNAGRDAACLTAERIRSMVEHEASIWEYPVTISIGVAAFPKDGDNLDDLLLKAECANTFAKKSGKNCIK